MESRLRVLLLIVCAFALGGCSMWPFHRKHHAPQTLVDTTADESSTAPVVEPQVTRRKVHTQKIRKSNFEFGGSLGLLNVEDFGSNGVGQARLVYHITEDFFAEGIYGESRLGLTSYERLSGGARLLTDAQRKVRFYTLDMGYDVLPGEVYVGKRRTFNSALYVVAGVGGTRFGGDTRFTVTVGAGYRLVLNDWMAAHLDIRDHLLDTDVLGSMRKTNNLESTLGVTVFF
ncbi:MAG: outer membrane beta-barrel domain-containing protein [Pseudomonadota bacterium]